MSIQGNPYSPPQTDRLEEQAASATVVDSRGYRIAPLDTERMPPGIPFIVGNEAAERFSYYGMRSILIVFMMHYVVNTSGELATVPQAEARVYFHWFMTAVYFFPLLGSLLSDGVLGKYRTIIALSIVYCLGHLALALDESWRGLAIGLGLIAIGSGGIKPCVSAHVGDQFSQRNERFLERVYGWFYMSINFGSFFSTLLIPELLDHYGPNVAFGVPGILMLLATIVFWMGRKRYAHIPPGGLGFVREAFSREGAKTLGRLFGLFLFVAVFWALYDQTGAAWVQQSEHMDLDLFGWELLPSQVHSANPLLILILVPLFAYVIYPAVETVVRLTPLRKIGAGFVLTALSFLVVAWIERRIEAGETPTVWWQIFAYVFITSGEVMVSVVGLEFSYTQAPRTMKSLVVALWYLSVSLGNFSAAQVNSFLQDDNGELRISQVDYYLLFAAIMAAATVVYVGYAMTYRERMYLQDAGTLKS
jgi:POT family proton-dependent oligopeptide transporter